MIGMTLRPLPFTREQIWTLPLEELAGPDWREKVQAMADLIEGTPRTFLELDRRARELKPRVR